MVPCLPHGCIWDEYSGGYAMPGSPSVPRVAYSGAPLWLHGAFASPPTCVAGSLGATVLLPGVGSGSGSSGGGLQDAPGEYSGSCGPAGPKFYSWLFLLV